MKFLIASDLHGSAYYAKLLLDFAQRENPDKILLLGDLLYHGARNSLPRDYSPPAVAALLSSVKEKILAVKGNCDSEVDSCVLEFPLEAQLLLLPLPNGKTGLLTHGHKLPTLSKGDVLFCGHFHVPAFERREYTYVNCGSVSIPKENSPHSCLLLENNSLIFQDLELGEVFRRESL